MHRLGLLPCRAALLVEAVAVRAKDHGLEKDGRAAAETIVIEAEKGRRNRDLADGGAADVPRIDTGLVDRCVAFCQRLEVTARGLDPDRRVALVELVPADDAAHALLRVGREPEKLRKLDDVVVAGHQSSPSGPSWAKLGHPAGEEKGRLAAGRAKLASHSTSA